MSSVRDNLAAWKSVLESVECPVCLEIFTNPVYICQSGHSVCGNCKKQIRDNRCPTCRKGITNKRNFKVEDIASKCQYFSLEAQTDAELEQVNDLEKKISSLKKELGDEKSKVSTLAVEAKKTKILENQISQLKQQIAVEKQKSKCSNADISYLQDELKKIHRIQKNTEAELKNSQSAMVLLQSDSKGRLSLLTDELEKLRRIHNNTKVELKDSRSAVTQLQHDSNAEICLLTNELEKLRRIHNNTEVELKDYRSAVTQLQHDSNAEICFLTDEIEKSRKKIMSQQKKLKDTENVLDQERQIYLESITDLITEKAIKNYNTGPYYENGQWHMRNNENKSISIISRLNLFAQDVFDILYHMIYHVVSILRVDEIARKPFELGDLVFC